MVENKIILKLVHDLNNLLCATTWFTEVLLNSEDRGYQKKLLEINRDSLVKMANILDTTRVSLIEEMRKDPI